MPINQNYPPLSTTPIKEIIFTVSYSESIPNDVLKRFQTREEISKKFVFVGDGFAAQISNSNQNEPKASIFKDGLVLRCTDENKVIQARQGSFSFHKVNGYENFDILLPQFIYYWNIFLSSIDDIKLTINNISLRYLNLIDLTNGEKYSDISTIRVDNPFLEEVDKYLIRFEFVSPEDKDLIIGVVQAPIISGSKNSLMLDTNINRAITSEVNSDLLGEYLEGMRHVKNGVFFNTVTEKGIERYI